jgi:hypothetical protein
MEDSASSLSSIIICISNIDLWVQVEIKTKGKEGQSMIKARIKNGGREQESSNGMCNETERVEDSCSSAKDAQPPPSNQTLPQ